MVPEMTFGEALELLKQGRRMRRRGWNREGMWLELYNPDKKMTHPYLVINIPGCEEGLRVLPWQPAQVDLFAEDWEIA